MSDRPVYSYKIGNIVEFFQQRGNRSLQGYLRLKIEKIDNMSGQLKATHALIRFETGEEQDQAYTAIRKHLRPSCMTQSSGGIEQFTRQWRTGALTTYEYLQVINIFAQCSTLDLNQYPVFPWVIKDYESDQLDLGDPETYREFSRPIGGFAAAGGSAAFRGSRKSVSFACSRDDVLNLLVRQHPAWRIKCHDKLFEHPNEVFGSVKKEWLRTVSLQDCVHELTPEFYSSEQSGFLVNSMRLDLGTQPAKANRI